MDLQEKVKQQEQQVTDSRVQALNAKANQEELQKQHHMELGGLLVLRQLAAEAEAEKAELARQKKKSDKPSGKAGEKS